MKFQRTFTIAARAINADSRTIEMAISSETPVERWFGTEILDHSPESIDLTRLADGRHPLLLNHCTDDQIGVLSGPTVGEDRMLRCSAKFSRSALGQEILQDVQDGIRELVSVGYMIDEVRVEAPVANAAGSGARTLSGEEFEREMEGKYGHNWYRTGKRARDAGEPADEDEMIYRVTRWTPFEASIVPIPADANVGVGRAAGAAQPATQGLEPPAGAGTDSAAIAAPATVYSEPKAHPDTTRSRIMTEENKGPADLERERVKQICDLGEQYAKYIDQKDIANACRMGHSVEQFKDNVMTKMESRHSDTRSVRIGMNTQEIQRYSLARAIVASITGDWSKAGLEQEASRAVAGMLGKSPEGFFAPYDAFQRDFNVGTTTEAGNLVATDLRTDLYVDALRNKLVMVGMGMRVLPGLTASVAIPRKSVAGTLGMLTEIGSGSETNPNIAQVTLSPKRVGAYVEYSKQALIQSAMALEPMLRDDLLSGAAVLLENQMLNGAGTGAEMKGIRNVTGIGTVLGGTHGSAPAWSHFVDLESACANSNSEPDRLAGYLVNTKTRGKAKQTTKSTYLGWLWDNGDMPINGYRAGVTNNLASNLTKGTSTTICSPAIFGSDFSMAVLGLFGAPDITVDPYTLAATGQVRITLNQFADFGVRQPAAFAKIDDLLSG